MSSDAENEKFLAMLEQHKKIVFKVCNAYCKEAESRKDLAQEIFIQLWKSHGSYNGQYKLSTWIYRIALNVAISFYRRGKKHVHSALTESAIDIADESEHPQETENNISLLHQFIDELDELHKALMILYLDNNSYKDIAEVLGISETNVATKISRIKQKLKEKFENINR
jgi:RNA polymerase sigma factor (sigma-70 family)